MSSITPPELSDGSGLRPAAYRPPPRLRALRSVAQSESVSDERVVARGKFLYLNGKKFFVRGVTYGPFGLDGTAALYKSDAETSRDFAAMAASGVNTVRTYTEVPRWFLDCAQNHGLKVIVGIAWTQHIAFLDENTTRKTIEDSVRQTVSVGKDHPAVLGYTVGNEIPAPIVRWYGPSRIERFLNRLFDIAKKADPNALFSYANYPTTEYLQLPFLDFLCFNVYLEEPERLSAYVARLQNIAEDKPVVLGELGLDSERNGLEKQASTLDWQIRAAFTGGCAGVCVFSWTDEWFRGGSEVTGWGFGLTDRERRPKPALDVVKRAFKHLPFPTDMQWPRISVVVCTYNGARYIRETCEALQKIDYPDYEVIAVCDGSTDETMSILDEFDINVIAVKNGGLSRARNLGLQASTGEIVAYLDDDAYPDVHWLKFLASSFNNSSHEGIGGPNFPPFDDPFWAFCVAHSPGGPNHVLLGDDLAEHIPGCNMAFRKSALERVGGFDRTFRIAGDDVDVCWKIQRSGGTLGFSPSAVVWHHRRNSATAYLRQQYNYGRAEAMLASKWPDKFNSAGHVKWGGRIYGSGRATPPFTPRVAIYQGTWGTAPFQSMYEKPNGLLTGLLMMPEWHLVVAVLGIFSLLGLLYLPFSLAVIALVPAVMLPMAQPIRGALATRIPLDRLSRKERWRARAVIALLHFWQPLIRLRGRLSQGLGLWYFRKRPTSMTSFGSYSFWHESWRSCQARLESVEEWLNRLGEKSTRGGDFDSWDLEVVGGIAGRARIVMAIEEHGGGRQLVRCRIEPRFSSFTRGIIGVASLVMLVLATMQATGKLFFVATIGLLILAWAMYQALSAAGVLLEAAEKAAASEP